MDSKHGLDSTLEESSIVAIFGCYAVCDLDLVDLERNLGQHSNRIGEASRQAQYSYFLPMCG